LSVLELDETDRRLLNELLRDSRQSFRELARNTGVSVATALSRVRRLEKAGAIRGYTCLLDYEKLGYDVSVQVSLKISKGKLFEVERQIASSPNVALVYDVTGSYDATVIAKFRSRRAMDAFLKKIQTYDFVERTETQLILNTMKEAPVTVE
jgi:DNA-binding Lrp family transcriptional regulator